MKKPNRFVGVLMVTLASLVTLLVLPVQAQTSQAAWKVSYYNNIYLSDPPVVDTTVTQINFNWGSSSPAAGVNRNNWSARFGTDVFFTPATYRFSVRADDEFRLWIDYKPVLSTMDAGQPGSTLTIDVPLGGSHHIQLDYRERSGDASLVLTWQDVRTVGLTPTANAQPGTGGVTALVNTSVLNVRSAPNLGATVLTKIARGQTYTVLGRTSDGTWYKLDVLGQQGWASAAYLAVSNPAGVPVVSSDAVPVNPNDTLVRAYARLNFRSGPSTAASVLQIIPANTSLKVVGRSADGAWLKVAYAGQEGWVALAVVQVLTPQTLGFVPTVQS